VDEEAEAELSRAGKVGTYLSCTSSTSTSSSSSSASLFPPHFSRISSIAHSTASRLSIGVVGTAVIAVLICNSRHETIVIVLRSDAGTLLTA
jgi:hypothetical protein